MQGMTYVCMLKKLFARLQRNQKKTSDDVDAFKESKETKQNWGTTVIAVNFIGKDGWILLSKFWPMKKHIWKIKK